MNLRSDITQKYLDIAGSMILVLNPDGTVELINKRGSDILGYPEKEIVGKNWFDHFLPETIREQIREVFQKVQNDEVPLEEVFENAVLTRQGEERIIAWNNSLIRDESGDIIGTLSSGQDITRRIVTERELRKSEEKYRSFFEDDLTADYITTPEGRLLFCNPAYLDIFGFPTLEEALNYNIQDLYHSSKDRNKLLTELRKKKRLKNYEMQLQKADGSPLFVTANVIGRFDEQDNLIEIKGYLFDVTQHKKTEEQFWLAQKMEAIGRLAGGVAHDFNNLLSVINGYSDLAMHRLSKNHMLQKDLSMIFQAGKKAEALTRQLLAFSRRQVMQPRIIDLNILIDDLEKMLKRLIEEDIQLITQKDPDLGAVKADPTQIEQVLLNLAVNSRDAMPQGGKLIIETSNVLLSSDLVHERVTMSAGPYVLIVVTDTGVGMDEQTMANIFEPFFTTKEKGKGTGLGLSTVYGIIKQSGGYIWVYSEPGKGTTFKIYLPQVIEEVEDLVIQRSPPETLKGKETILLVEDDQGVRDVSEMILREFGYQVLKAENGEEALQVIEKNGKEIQLMITDLVMPGMSGKELTDRLSGLENGFKVLYLSGYTDEAIVHHGILDKGI
ncbi:MAG: PAS domain S-box protein, partial [Calditrichae bacterium]|nr:PAS domain S-box protein [Calditrichia bacterium]